MGEETGELSQERTMWINAWRPGRTWHGMSGGRQMFRLGEGGKFDRGNKVGDSVKFLVRL